eukprot:c7980_g1_i1.p1 GENE.c7980_g1_i1~~c7980_g1_i1.p1  ORF type:complete len:113 (-),score=15.91 c7980_g1_i1:169-507(-)
MNQKENAVSETNVQADAEKTIRQLTQLNQTLIVRVRQQNEEIRRLEQHAVLLQLVRLQPNLLESCDQGELSRVPHNKGRAPNTEFGALTSSTKLRTLKARNHRSTYSVKRKC